MTRRHEQISHRRKLSEIRNIMNSMKTLAVMEAHKLERIIVTQTKLKFSIEKIAGDFLQHYRQVLPDVEPTTDIILLVGSERGFCGDFNEILVKKIDELFQNASRSHTTLISIGQKLHYLVNEKHFDVINIQGASVVEDITNVVDSISEIFSTRKNLSSLYVLHHNGQHNALITNRLMPPFKDIGVEEQNKSNPPLLNLTAQDFLLELIEHYLFNSLHRILYVSLMVENQRRIQHLENATHHLDNKTEELKHKINALRQEEIIEEIEVILLNASNN